MLSARRLLIRNRHQDASLCIETAHAMPNSYISFAFYTIYIVQNRIGFQSKTLHLRISILMRVKIKRWERVVRKRHRAAHPTIKSGKRVKRVKEENEPVFGLRRRKAVSKGRNVEGKGYCKSRRGGSAHEERAGDMLLFRIAHIHLYILYITHTVLYRTAPTVSA